MTEMKEMRGMERYIEKKVVGRGGFGVAVRCTRKSDSKVRAPREMCRIVANV